MGPLSASDVFEAVCSGWQPADLCRRAGSEALVLYSTTKVCQDSPRSGLGAIAPFRGQFFLNDIEKAANEKSLPSQMRHIRRLPDSVGIVNDELPWDGMKIAARIDALGKRARAMRDVRRQQDEEIYKRAARYFYDDLRAAWERALEEVAFAHVIMRH